MLLVLRFVVCPHSVRLFWKEKHTDKSTQRHQPEASSHLKHCYQEKKTQQKSNIIIFINYYTYMTTSAFRLPCFLRSLSVFSIGRDAVIILMEYKKTFTLADIQHMHVAWNVNNWIIHQHNRGSCLYRMRRKHIPDFCGLLRTCTQVAI